MKAFAEELKVILDYSKGISLNALVASWYYFLNIFRLEKEISENIW